MPSVAIVDDHACVAEGLERVIATDPAFKVTGVFNTGESFLGSLHGSSSPDLCVLDLSLPGISGADVLRTLHLERPEIKVIVVSAADRSEVVARCLTEGASGFVSKNQPSTTLLEAMHAVADGRRYIDPDLVGDTIVHLTNRRSGNKDAFDDLSAREYAVMERLAQGQSIKEIAAVLNLNPKTISTYRARLLSKLGLTTNAELTALCLSRGMISIPVGAAAAVS
jgi:DNA-binding NarL/FixJ family response regulator